MLNTVPTRRPAEMLIPRAPRVSAPAHSKCIVETIFQGVTQDIFGAFQRTHPQMFRREFEGFVTHVRQGLGHGVGEAKEELVLAGKFAGEGETMFHANSARLFERLEVWFVETRARLFS